METSCQAVYTKPVTNLQVHCAVKVFCFDHMTETSNHSVVCTRVWRIPRGQIYQRNLLLRYTARKQAL